MATSLISKLLWTFAHSFTFINHLSATRTRGPSPANVVHPWCPRFVQRDSSFCSFGSRFSCLPSCSFVLFSWVFYNSENWPWALSSLIGNFLTSATRESGIWEIFACGIRNPGLWIPEYSSRNPKSHKQLESRIQVSLTKTRIQYLEYKFHGVESRIQDCLGFSYIWRNNSFVAWDQLDAPVGCLLI